MMIQLPELTIGDLTCPVPIIQGGMGVGISLSRLSAAVANQGGIGVIAAAMVGILEPDIAEDGDLANCRALAREIRKARLQTRGILGVNIMVALTSYGRMVRTAIAEGIDIIFSGAGLPLDLPQYLTPEAKTKLAPIVSSARAAAIICKKWLSRYDYLPDAIVVEGPKAGGHIGFKLNQIDDPAFTLENLVRDVLAEVKPFEARNGKPIPVIAAGGIYSGADIHKFLQMGVSGVQLGTRFVATHECDADLAFKESYVAAGKEDMTVIKSPVGMPGRAVRNEFLDAVRQGRKTPFKCPFHCLKTCDPLKSPYCIAIALGNARKGKLKHGFAFAGENAYRIQEIVSVKALMDSLKAEYRQTVERENCRLRTLPQAACLQAAVWP
ncbi:MAG: nitronate monooxygenase family protein [Desulfobacterales bacterium]